jgi:hypothetical protein
MAKKKEYECSRQKSVDGSVPEIGHPRNYIKKAHTFVRCALSGFYYYVFIIE